MKRQHWARLSCLILAAAAAEALAACGGDPPPHSGNSSSVTTGVGGAGGSGGSGDGGGGGGGGSGYEWPVDTYPIDITPSADWKNQITFPYEPFLSWPTGVSSSVQWVKFTVLMHDPTKVYFQDSSKYWFHAEFATERLDPFIGLSVEQFDQISLHAKGQEAILGAVLFSPGPGVVPEYGIQLVRKDAYDPEMARVVLDLVKKSVIAPDGVQPFYFPTFEQFESATQNSAFFQASGFPVSTAERWTNGSSCYSTGWALGRLRYVPPDQIDTAYASGELKAEDILLTDAVPAEVPYVAGIISLSPSTPNAHTAILATSFGIPFIYLGDPAEAKRAKELADKDVILRAKLKYDSLCDASLFDAEGQITPADREGLLALKEPGNLGIQPKQTLGAVSASTDDLGPADIVHFGGKASNYGLLRDAIPESSQEALAFSFDLWDSFLDQTMPGGKTLRAEIQEKLSGYTYPPNLVALKGDLAAIRDRIKDNTVFSGAQKQSIEAALAGFDPKTKIRFRSSTNVEDSAVFTGAGLYDSYSGCLADDKDADEAGPSLCEAAESSERGVYRAIRKVYASFYNDNAFLARLRYGVNESDVGMGMLVHYSYPDEDEMANGVATHARGALPMDDIKLVTQVGAVSVTNPEGGAQPEVTRVIKWDSSNPTGVDYISGSTLVPLGGHVMTWEDDYLALGGLLGKVADRFAEVHPGKPTFLLDYEYKKMKPGKLIVKQVREVALPDKAPTLTPFLINEPQNLCTAQGEYGDVFGNHRLKVRLNVTTRTTWLTPAALAETIFGETQASYVMGGAVKTLTGSPASWPGASHTFMAGSAEDVFTDGTGNDLRTYTLTTALIPELLPPSEGPIVALSDFDPTLAAVYATPVPTMGWDAMPTTTSSESVRLGGCPEDNVITSAAILKERTFTAPGGVTMKTSFYWPPPPTGVVAGYTAPLFKWVETTINGLTKSPIVLKGYYSQTYRPGHHNFSEDFLFEPALEEGVDPALLAELEALGIRQIYVSGEVGNAQMMTIDPAGGFHSL